MAQASGDAPAVLTLDDVATRLREADQNGAITLSAETPLAEEVDDLLTALGVAELELRDPQVQLTADNVTVAGKASLAGVPTDAQVIFTLQQGALSVALHAAPPEQTLLQLPALPWATVKRLSLDLSVAGPSLGVSMASCSVSGAIALEGLAKPIDVTLQPAIGQGDWVLSGRSIELPDPVAILGRLLPGQDGHALMPSTLGSGDDHGLEIVELACGFDPSTLAVHSVLVAVGAPGKTWTFAPGVPQLPALSDLMLSLRLAFPEADADEDAAVDFTATAAARILLGGLDLPVRVTGNPDEWRFGIVEAHGFPNLGQLIETVTDASTAQMLPTALTGLGMETASLEVAVAAADGALRSIFFSTHLAKHWPIIEDPRTGEAVLALDQVALELLVDRAGGSTSGFFTGVIALDGLSVPVAVSKPGATAPLTLRLGTAAAPKAGGTSSLSGFVGGGDVGTHLPPDFPELPFTLQDLTIAFDATTYAVSEVHLEVHADGPWSLHGPSKASVGGLKLNLRAKWPGPEVTGSLGGFVQVGETKITIDASKPDAAGPWQIQGALAPGSSVSLGAVAAEFGDFDVPPALRDATLTSLTITFDTNGDFSFHAVGSLAADGRPGPKLTLDSTVKQQPDGGTAATFEGTLTIEERDFTFAVEGDKAQTRFLAAYTHEGKAADTIAVRDLVAAISPAAADDIPDVKVDLKDVIFATAAGAGTPRFLFALHLERLDLSGLPLVGAKLADAATVEDLQVVGMTAAPVEGDVAAWNALLQGKAQLPATLDSGVSVAAKLQVADTPTPIGLSVPPPKAQAAAVAAPPADSTKWFPVQRAFGPVYLTRVGARYDAGALWLLLDASLSLGGLSLALNGLSVGSPLSAFEPKFRLDGIGLAYKQDPVEIAGAFFAVPASQLGNPTDGSFQYDGAAVVRAEDFTLAALGSYAEIAGHPSLFVFAELDYPLGGPPAAYVTGLMGGFGYNRGLRIPTQDEVYKFPFVQGIAAGTPGDGTPTGVLKVLEGVGDPAGPPWVYDAPGQNWLAVGVVFTSFELAETHALLIAEFGHELQFALLGLTKLRLPKDPGEPAFAYVELEVEAVLKPNEGFFGLTAVLSPNSFVFAPECRLTGGFAFYVWFDGDHAGDFVLTLGGYHPAFKPQPWYPQEPRLSLTWPVNDLVTIDGSAYFALTPSCVMGGGGLHLLFHDGNLQAWLRASADFLISWAPFSYSVDIGVSVGVSYRVDWAGIKKTFSVELGAQLHLAGPPTHGRAHISWWIISFEVEFGEQATSTPVVNGWGGFKKLLPDDKDLCKVVIQSGLLPQPPSGETIVRGDALQVATECAVPATELKLATVEKPFATPGKQAPAIRPLGLAAIESTHTLHVRDGAGKEIDVVQGGWKIEARTRNVPEALWGAPLDGDPPPSADLVPEQLIGFTITPPGARLGATRGVVEMKEVLAPVTAATGVLPFTSAAAPSPGAPAEHAVKKIADSISAKSVVGARSAIRTVLKAQGLDPLTHDTDDALDSFAAKAGTAFPKPPMLSSEAA